MPAPVVRGVVFRAFGVFPQLSLSRAAPAFLREAKKRRFRFKCLLSFCTNELVGGPAWPRVKRTEMPKYPFRLLPLLSGPPVGHIAARSKDSLPAIPSRTRSGWVRLCPNFWLGENSSSGRSADFVWQGGVCCALCSAQLHLRHDFG